MDNKTNTTLVNWTDANTTDSSVKRAAFYRAVKKLHGRVEYTVGGCIVDRLDGATVRALAAELAPASHVSVIS